MSAHDKIIIAISAISCILFICAIVAIGMEAPRIRHPFDSEPPPE